MDIALLLNELAAPDVSDILLEAGMFPALRVNSELRFLRERPRIEAADIDAFRKGLAGETGEAGYREDGGLDCSYDLKFGRCRINFFTTIRGPGMAVRPIRDGGLVDFEKFGLPLSLEKLCAAPRGLILVTGATGSGKTTTLTAMVNFINTRFARHILMIEDPTEFLHVNRRSIVTQREIDSLSGGTFIRALRFALRENPDVIVIGEIRDRETLQTALNAALTGHLVIATLHTIDAIRTVERMAGLYPENLRYQAAQDISLALNAILSQRLVPSADGLRMLPVMEILVGTPTVRKQIAELDLDALDLTLRSGRHQGMETFNRALLKRYQAGEITFATAVGAAGNPDEFKLLVRGIENGGDPFGRYGTGEESSDGALPQDEVDVKMLLRAAVKNGASDLILTVGVAPQLKIGGTLRSLELPPLNSEDAERLIFSVLTRRQRVVLEEKKELDFALAVTLENVLEGEETTLCRFRLNAFYQRNSLGLVARVINSRIPEPEKLHLPAILPRLVKKKQGLLLVTGPTGSGKSTTMASLIDRINAERSCHIVTIEDPIEYVYRNRQAVIEQRELNDDTLSFAGALRAALREAPDVILVGEMRDIETMAAALTAAETGHLVMATLHTNSAAQSVDRLVDSFPAGQQNQIRQQLAATLLAVVSQRLIPRKDGGLAAAIEVMVGTPPVRALIRENKTHLLQATLETGFKDGMITLERSLTELYEAGEITLEESKRFAVDCRPVKSF